MRFLDSEWERIEAFAEARGLTGSEFVRFAALAATADPGEATGRLVRLIETTFRATHIMVTKMRDDMVDAGRMAELEKLIQAALPLQDRNTQPPVSDMTTDVDTSQSACHSMFLARS